MKIIKIIVLLLVFWISILNLISKSEIAKVKNNEEIIKEKSENIIIKDEITIAENVDVNVENEKAEIYNNEKAENIDENKKEKKHNIMKTSTNNKKNINELTTQQEELQQKNNIKENIEIILEPIKSEYIHEIGELPEYNKKVGLIEKIDGETKINLND